MLKATRNIVTYDVINKQSKTDRQFLPLIHTKKNELVSLVSFMVQNLEIYL